MVFGLLGWALTFIIVALIAGLFGFGFIAGTSIAAAKILFWIFVIFLVITLIMRLVRGNW